MRKVKHVITALLLSAGASFGAFAEEAFKTCPQFFVGGVSPQVPNARELGARPLCFDSFAVLHSAKSKTPVFVAERLNRAQLLDAKDEVRTNRFYEEARLPSAERAKLADYKATLKGPGDEEFHFDRGHLAPAADMPNAQAMAQSFSLANMVPQAPENNRGVWAKSVEKATRQYVMRAAGDVYVITGPVYSEPATTLGPSRVWVPDYLFKLVYDATTGRAWAYWVENSNYARASRPITYEELVKRTGIEFLPGAHPRS